MKKILVVFALIILSKSSIAQFSLKTNCSYMTDKKEATYWGFTIEPLYKLSQHFRLGVTTSFFLNGNEFPNYFGYGLTWNSSNEVLTAHRILPIELSTIYYFNKNGKAKLQPHIQLNSGITILGTYTKANINSAGIVYQNHNHYTETYFSLGARIGVDYSINKNVDFSINAGYSKVMENSKNRFADAPIDLNNYNLQFAHYFIFETGFKYNFH